MKKTSVKPTKNKSVKKNSSKKTQSKHNNIKKSLNASFFIGFAMGAMIVAVVDYLDDKHKEMRRIEKGSDADYYYTTE